MHSASNRARERVLRPRRRLARWLVLPTVLVLVRRPVLVLVLALVRRLVLELVLVPRLVLVLVLVRRLVLVLVRRAGCAGAGGGSASPWPPSPPEPPPPPWLAALDLMLATCEQNTRGLVRSWFWRGKCWGVST